MTTDAATRAGAGRLVSGVVWNALGRGLPLLIALLLTPVLLRLMGGNGIETMMNGHAALVNKRIPDTLMLRFFPEMWPILPIENEEDIYLAAKKALDDPEACRQLAAKGRQWILEYHSHARIVQKNCEAYAFIWSVT